MGGCAASTLRGSPAPVHDKSKCPRERWRLGRPAPPGPTHPHTHTRRRRRHPAPVPADDAAPQGPKVFVLEVDATLSKVETWHAAAAAQEDRIAALQVRPVAALRQLFPAAAACFCAWSAREPFCLACTAVLHLHWPPPPALPSPQSPSATENEENPQQPGAAGSAKQGRPPLPPAAAASSSSSKAGGTRARRLSLPGEPAAGGGRQAAPQAPAASATGSSAGVASAAPTSSASSSASGPAAPPAALSAQPALPEAHPLPQRRVRFDDSPVKTHKLPEEEAEEEAEAHVQPHLPPIRTGTEPAAALSVVQAPAQQAAPQRAGSPSKVIFEAALAARSGLPTLAAAAAATAGASPRKSAAALAVPMSDLIHSVASLSRAGREPTHRKTNQASLGGAWMP